VNLKRLEFGKRTLVPVEGPPLARVFHSESSLASCTLFKLGKSVPHVTVVNLALTLGGRNGSAGWAGGPGRQEGLEKFSNLTRE
jgi:hypothetical protein